MRWLWIIVLMALALPAALPRKMRRAKPTPRLFGDRVPVQEIRTDLRRVQQKIVDVHNHFRRQVQPPAANMLKMRWHPQLASAAQAWANRCPGLMHDNTSARYLNNFGQSGQNIFLTTGRTLWNFAIRMWFKEYKDFKYGADNSNNFRQIGHYTQVVWATTYLVGCGVKHCTNSNGPFGRDYTLYVCNYAPSGNGPNIGLPYVAGQPCSMCKNHCSRNLCTNSCDYSNRWSNCDDLNRTFHSWICGGSTIEGYKRRMSCAATCNCAGKIY